MAATEKRELQRRSLRLVFAAAVVGMALLLQLTMMKYFAIEAPFIAFHPAVIVVAIFAGFWPGLMATCLSALSVSFFVMEPRGVLHVARTSDVVSLFFFLASGVFISAIAHRYHSNQRRIAELEKQASVQASEERLRQSQERFQTLANAIPQLTWMANPDGWIFWYNQRWYSYTGTTPEQMEGWGWQRVHHPEILPAVVEKWTASLATGQPFDMVFPLLGADGIYRPFLTRVVPVKDSAGKIIRWFGTNTDISEQRRVEEILRSSEAKLQAVVSTAMDAIISVDEEQRIVVFNRSAELVFQCAASEAIGSTLDRFIPDSAKGAHREHVRRFGSDEAVTARSMSSPGMFNALRSNGEEFPIEATISKVEAGGQMLFTVILRDITERKRAEELLRKSKARLDLAVEVANLGEWEINLVNGKGTRSSRHAKIFGYPPNEHDWSYERFLSHVLPQCRAQVEEALRSAAMDRTWDFETQVQRLDGDVRWIWVRGRFVLDEANQPTRSFGTVMDITDRKQAEQALLRSEKLASVGRMAASIAHEINNPLEATINALYIAKSMTNVPREAREYLDIADAEVKRITHIVRQSLGFYRESNGPTSTAVTAVMESALDLLKSKINKKNAKIEKQWRVDEVIIATAGELRQVFSNLLSNSLDAIKPGGTIKVRVSAGESIMNGRRYVRVTIADDGQGIEAASLQHLFEPFFTTKGTVGTGLGLWVSKQIIDKHGGTIRVRSKTTGDRKGTVFSIVLPEKPEAALSRTARAGTDK